MTSPTPQAPAREAVELPEPAAWVSFNVLTQKEIIGRLPITSMQPGVYQHRKLYDESAMRTYALATLAARAVPGALPAGWIAVPIEPTHEMLDEAGRRLAEQELPAESALERQADAHIAWDGMIEIIRRAALSPSQGASS